MSVLAFTVYVKDGDGETHCFERGVEPPDWAVAKITNPLAWEGEEVDVPIVVERPEYRPKPPDPGAGVTPPPAVVAGPPPQAGPGASRQAWADYAEANGVGVEPDWKRDAIIDACDQAGVPVE